MKSLTDVVSGCVLLGLCAVGAWSASSLPTGVEGGVGPGSVPKAVLVILAALSGILIASGLRRGPGKRYWPEAPVLKKILFFFGLFYGYLLTLAGLGAFWASMEDPPFTSGFAFSLSTFLFLLLALPLLGRRRPVEVLSVAVLTTAVLLAAFGWFFQVMLP